MENIRTYMYKQGTAKYWSNWLKLNSRGKKGKKYSHFLNKTQNTSKNQPLKVAP